MEGEAVFYSYRGKGGKRGRRELPRPAYEAILVTLADAGKGLATMTPEESLWQAGARKQGVTSATFYNLLRKYRAVAGPCDLWVRSEGVEHRQPRDRSQPHRPVHGSGPVPSVAPSTLRALPGVGGISPQTAPLRASARRRGARAAALGGKAATARAAAANRSRTGERPLKAQPCGAEARLDYARTTFLTRCA